MSIIQLPAIINAPRFRKDKSISISFDSRELTPAEQVAILSLQGTEGYLLFKENAIQEEEIPQGDAELETKTQSQRMKSVLYKLYLQDTGKQKFVGSFESYYKQKTELVIEKYKSLIED